MRQICPAWQAAAAALVILWEEWYGEFVAAPSQLDGEVLKIPGRGK